MSNTSIVYGCIASFMWKVDSDWKLLWKLNRKTIERFIDSQDPSWLTGLFAVPHVDEPACTWQYQIIHFGGSYKNLTDRWDDWREEFEKLLAQLYWHKVKVHLEEELIGEFTYQWTATDSAIQSLYLDPPVPVTSWSFEQLSGTPI